jgi:phosphopantothenoylcysteine synthetase/decarboxylase
VSVGRGAAAPSAGAPPVDGKPPGRFPCGRVLVAVTGSPAALSMPQYVLILRQTLASEVRVVMSRGAQKFVRPYTMRLFAGRWVHTDTYSARDVLIPHIALTDDIDLLLVMPATANAIGKAAHGICDDLVSTAIVAADAPVVLVPTMNGRMWASRAVQRNVGLARELGYHVIDPGYGFQLADGEDAVGLMPPLEHVLGELTAIVNAAQTERGAQRERRRPPR